MIRAIFTFFIYTFSLVITIRRLVAWTWNHKSPEMEYPSSSLSFLACPFKHSNNSFVFRHNLQRQIEMPYQVDRWQRMVSNIVLYQGWMKCFDHSFFFRSAQIVHVITILPVVKLTLPHLFFTSLIWTEFFYWEPYFSMYFLLLCMYVLCMFLPFLPFIDTIQFSIQVSLIFCWRSRL